MAGALNILSYLIQATICLSAALNNQAYKLRFSYPSFTQQKINNTMDVMTAAVTLRKELVAYHNSEIMVNRLGSEIISLNEQSLRSAMEDSQSHHLRLLLRLSVSEGVHHMYKQFSTKKWAQVQTTARSIKSSLEGDNNEPMLSSPQGGSTSPDRAADQWTTVFCEHSRNQ